MATARKSRSKNGHSDSLVDLDAGLISREVFVNPEIYAQEQEQLFARAWLYIGHESQISKPGDFFVSSMGCLLYTAPSPRDATLSPKPSSA